MSGEPAFLSDPQRHDPRANGSQPYVPYPFIPVFRLANVTIWSSDWLSSSHYHGKTLRPRSDSSYSCGIIFVKITTRNLDHLPRLHESSRMYVPS